MLTGIIVAVLFAAVAAGGEVDLADRAPQFVTDPAPAKKKRRGYRSRSKLAALIPNKAASQSKKGAVAKNNAVTARKVSGKPVTAKPKKPTTSG